MALDLFLFIGRGDFVQLQHSKSCSEGIWKWRAESTQIRENLNFPAPHVCCFIWLSENPPALRVNILIIIFTQNQPEIFLKKHIKHQFPVLPIFAALQVFIMLRPSLALRAWGKDETGTALTTFAEQTWLLFSRFSAHAEKRHG